MNDQKQQRNTRQRKLIYEEVLSRCDHPNAETIYRAVQQKDAKISRGTVYRNLNLLAQKGDITYVSVPGCDRFDSRQDRHYHVICTRCGKVVDAPQNYQDLFDQACAEATGFQIERHRTIFQGICPECQANEQQGHSEQPSKERRF